MDIAFIVITRIFCLLLSAFIAVDCQFVIDRGERDIFRNLTGCTSKTRSYCYFYHAEESPLDKCVCRCMADYPMYRNPDVYLSGGGQFLSKGKPACVWHSNHRYECFHIRKLGRGERASDDEGALEFDFSRPGNVMAYSDHDLSSCSVLETAIKMPEDSRFTRKRNLLTASFSNPVAITFQWKQIAERYNGGILRGVFRDCENAMEEASRCFVGKISGVYSGGKCKVRAVNGECCVFPFTYKGQVYNNCTTIDRERPWCAVKLPFFGNETDWWNFCSKNSPSSSSMYSTIASSFTSTVIKKSVLPPTLTVSKSMNIFTVFSSVQPSSQQTPSTQTLKKTTTELPETSILVPSPRVKLGQNSRVILGPVIRPPLMSSSVSSLLVGTTEAATIKSNSNVPKPSNSNVPKPSNSNVPKPSNSNVPKPSNQHSTIAKVAPFGTEYVLTATSDYLPVPSKLNYESSVSHHLSVVDNESTKRNLISFSRVSQTSTSAVHSLSYTVRMPSPAANPKTSDENDIATIIVIVMASVAFLVVFTLGCCFVWMRTKKKRVKNYGLIDKKVGSPAQQPKTPLNPVTQVHNEDPSSEIVETEFTIPEKNEQLSFDKSRCDRDSILEPAYMTFRL